jgi:hypothetical protein
MPQLDVQRSGGDVSRESSRLRDKIDHLRNVATAYLKDAASATDQQRATRLIMLAARIQEQILELEEQTKADRRDPNRTT